MRKRWPFSELIMATANQKKLEQFQDLLGDEFSLKVIGLEHFPQIPAIEEDQDSFIGNAKKKAETLSTLIQGPVIADDSGIVVPALNGKPGIYSARFAGPDASDAENNQKLLTEMSGLSADQRTAYYICVIALAIPGQSTQIVQGKCHGVILENEQGTGGFGYDPLFFLPNEGVTMAELSAARRYEISHRAIASNQLIQLLHEKYDFEE